MCAHRPFTPWARALRPVCMCCTYACPVPCMRVNACMHAFRKLAFMGMNMQWAFQWAWACHPILRKQQGDRIKESDLKFHMDMQMHIICSTSCSCPCAAHACVTCACDIRCCDASSQRSPRATRSPDHAEGERMAVLGLQECKNKRRPA